MSHTPSTQKKNISFLPYLFCTRSQAYLLVWGHREFPSDHLHKSNMDSGGKLIFLLVLVSAFHFFCLSTNLDYLTCFLNHCERKFSIGFNFKTDFYSSNFKRQFDICCYWSNSTNRSHVTVKFMLFFRIRWLTGNHGNRGDVKQLP